MNKPRMNGEWCGFDYSLAAHVVKMNRGWYRIDLYGEPIIDRKGIALRPHLRAAYATNRRDANNTAKLLVTGQYDTARTQLRLL